MKKLKYILGTGFGSGMVPVAPGTAGSLAALIPLYFILQYHLTYLVPVLAFTSGILTLWVSPWFEENYKKDPPILVLDEWAGQSIALIGISFGTQMLGNIIILLTAFILFRIFDILKPLGIKKLQDLPGGFGVLADDLLAGLYTFICLKSLIFIEPQFFGMA